jgi:hypothetical protein
VFIKKANRIYAFGIRIIRNVRVVKTYNSTGPQAFVDNEPIGLETFIGVVSIHKHEIYMARKIFQSIMATLPHKLNVAVYTESAQVPFTDSKECTPVTIRINTI